MESAFFRFVADVLKSPSRLGVIVVCVLLAVYSLSRLLPIWLGFLKDLVTTGTRSDAASLASLEREHSLTISLIREDLQANRENCTKQFEVQSRQADNLTEAVAGLRELLARTASMDNRIERAHQEMSGDLKEIKGYIGRG